ncbi:MAG: ATP-binding protein [Myxococcales bacterium]|nr:ATP-binding protein [Myxococcales bacterium]
MTAEPLLKQTRVDLGGLMKVLGEHLYSSPNVAIRELVQNAHDSCVRRRLESPEPFEPRIEIRSDPNAVTLGFEDTGAGLTDDEIEQYLATIGSGYTRVLREQGHDGLIGMFGLGFLSAFVVSDHIEVWTCSMHQPDRAWSFSSRSGQSYLVRPAPPRPVGTLVTLHLRPRFEELARPAPVRALLERYCCLLDVPIHCGDGPPVNAEPPPWRVDDPERSPLRRRRDALAFARRFEPGFDPLCTIPVEPGEGSDLRGLLWIQDAATYGTSDNRNVSVFVRGMLISRDEQDLLPPWAGFCGAVLESEALAPTASRESLQEDERYEAAQASVREALIEGLRRLAHDEPAAWRTVLRRHNEALLGAALCDPRLFDLLCDELTLPTSQGDLPAQTILARAHGRLHVSQAERGGFEELLFRALKVPVVQGVRYGALPFCRAYAERRRGRLVLVGTSGGDSELFTPATPTDDERRRLQQWFGNDEVEVIASRFAPEHLPFVAVPDREAELKHRIESDEADKRIAGAVLGLARQFTGSLAKRPRLRVHVNLDCPVIPALLAASPARVEAALPLLRPLLGLLSEGDDERIMPVDEALRGYCSAVVALVGAAGQEDR